MEARVRTYRIAMLALLVGFVTGCATYGQTDQYDNGQGQYDPYYGQNNGYDRYQSPTDDVGFFYSELSPYGEWVRDPRYGWVWFPRHVDPRWRPYTRGQWVDSDFGWTWASSEPFGWATYHYGRWAFDQRFGWLWVPGTVWGPAWVSWQHGNGYVGWAPLPPQVGFEPGIGIRRGGFNLSNGIAPRDYTFVEERRFLNPRIGRYVLPQVRNVTILHRTTNITNYTVANDRVINHGVPIRRIEQATGRRAERFRVEAAPDSRRTGVRRDVIRVYRPTQRNLETVQIGRRNNAGLTEDAPVPNRTEPQPPSTRQPARPPLRQHDVAVPIPVAPRARPVRRGTDSERQFRREQQALKASQVRQQRALEQFHRQEMTQSKARADARDVAARHAAELRAQQEQRQRGAQQLRARQQIEREAAKATADNASKGRKHRVKRPDKPGDQKKNDKKKDNQ